MNLTYLQDNYDSVRNEFSVISNMQLRFKCAHTHFRVTDWWVFSQYSVNVTQHVRLKRPSWIEYRQHYCHILGFYLSSSLLRAFNDNVSLTNLHSVGNTTVARILLYIIKIYKRYRYILLLPSMWNLKKKITHLFLFSDINNNIDNTARVSLYWNKILFE